MWEAINTNIQIFTNLRPRLARVSQWLGRCLARTFFGAFEAPGVTRATAMTTTMATARGRRDRPQIPKPTYFQFGFGQLPPDPLRESWHLPATGNSVNRAQPYIYIYIYIPLYCIYIYIYICIYIYIQRYSGRRSGTVNL